MAGIVGNEIRGEIYGDFVLLAEGSPLPPFVAGSPIPIGCGAGDFEPPVEEAGEIVEFATVEELRKFLNFPIYKFQNVPPEIEFGGAQVIQFAASKEVYKATIHFGWVDSASKEYTPVVQLWGQPKFRRPHPVFPVFSRSTGQAIGPTKVNFTPTPGVLLINAFGHMLQWIKDDVLYTLVDEREPRLEAIRALVDALVEI